MREYDFLNLSPPEFEQLCRDLLQRHLGSTFESFPEGRDQGIDLRSVSGDHTIIVQCKRYSELKQLMRSLKLELPKVKLLAPSRYIIASSLSLAPAAKDKILRLFEGYVQSTADILGKEDLNNLLHLYPEIEKKHIKLWLPGVAVLENLLHGQLVNEALFEWRKIEETIRTYVYNESFDIALDMLYEKGYVVISGNPGVGKTTLARMLVYHLMALGYEEFVFISGSIHDAYARYKPGVKQIFFYDDFLGSNFLGQKQLNNEDKRILSFIGQVNAARDKILIMTTREYILSQAKLQFEGYNDSVIELGKCVVDVAAFSEPVKAKILYNHLYFSKLPEEYIDSLIESGSYQDIIRHEAFNPRIIQLISDPEFWKGIGPARFPEAVLEFLDYPETIWLHAYESQISEFSKCILAILVTMRSGTGLVLLEDCRMAAQQFVKMHSGKYRINYSQIEFNKCIRELNDTFIATMETSNGGTLVEFRDPSIVDFLVQYLKGVPDLLEDIVSSSIFLEQLLSEVMLSDWESDMQEYFGGGQREFSPGGPVALIKQRIIGEWDQLESAESPFVLTDNGIQAVRKRRNEYGKLVLLVSKIPLEKYPDLRQFASGVFYRLAVPAEDPGTGIDAYLNLLGIFMNDHELDDAAIIRAWFNYLVTDEDFFQFGVFGDIFPDEFDAFMGNPDHYREGVTRFVAGFIETFPDGLDTRQIEGLEEILEFFNMSSYKPVKALMAKAQKNQYRIVSPGRGHTGSYLDEREEQKRGHNELFRQLKKRPGRSEGN